MLIEEECKSVIGRYTGNIIVIDGLTQETFRSGLAGAALNRVNDMKKMQVVWVASYGSGMRVTYSHAMGVTVHSVSSWTEADYESAIKNAEFLSKLSTWGKKIGLGN